MEWAEWTTKSGIRLTDERKAASCCLSPLQACVTADSLAADERHHFHASLYGMDPGVFCFSCMSLVLHLLGYPEQALKKKMQIKKLASQAVFIFVLQQVSTN